MKRSDSGRGCTSPALEHPSILETKADPFQFFWKNLNEKNFRNIPQNTMLKTTNRKKTFSCNLLLSFSAKGGKSSRQTQPKQSPKVPINSHPPQHVGKWATLGEASEVR